MIEQLFTIGTSIIFLFIGFYLGRSTCQKELIRPPQDTKKAVKKLLVKAGIIEYPSQADIDYRLSGEEKVDAERERVFREQFKL